MKALCLSDIHGNHPAVESILSQAKKDIALILVCGDWTTFGQPDQVKAMLRILQRTGLPVLGVAGNCDSAEIQKALEDENVSLDATGKEIGRIGFFGLSASNITPMLTPFEKPEQELSVHLQIGYEQVRNAETKVLVSHVPPFNTTADKLRNGSHAGSTAVRKFIEENEIDLCVCGHIHDAIGADTLRKTVIANVGPVVSGYYGIAQIGESPAIGLHHL